MRLDLADWDLFLKMKFYALFFYVAVFVAFVSAQQPDFSEVELPEEGAPTDLVQDMPSANGSNSTSNSTNGDKIDLPDSGENVVANMVGLGLSLSLSTAFFYL